MEQSRWLRLLIILLVCAVGLQLVGQVWAILHRFGDILITFFLAWLLAFVLTPATDFLRDELGVARPIAAALCYLALVVLVVGFIVLALPVVVEQVAQIAEALPAIAGQVPAWQSSLQAEIDRRNLGVDVGALVRGQELSGQLTALSTNLAQGTVALLAGVAGAIVSFILILILSMYMVLDGERIRASIEQLIPDEYEEDVLYFLESINRTFGGFLRGTIVQSILYGLGTAIVMLVAGMPYVLLMSLLAGLVVIVPVVGLIIGLVAPVGIAFGRGGLTLALIVTGALLALQQIIFNMIAPRLLANSLGLHPLLIFAALLGGSRVAGVAGAIFGVPVVAVVWAMLTLWLNRSPLGRLAAERQRALDDATPPPAAPGRRFQTITTIWQRVTTGPVRPRPPNSEPVDPRSTT